MYDFKDADVVSNAIQIMLDNLYLYEQEFDVTTTWVALVTGMETCFDADVSADTINARLSILITLTRMDAFTVMKIAWNVPAIDVVEYQIPSHMEAMLLCDQARNAYASATAPHFTTEYVLPPRVLVVQWEVHELRELHGWVAMSNCVVISNALVQGAHTARGTLALFNILGHETQHGILRAAEGSFNAHTPELVRGRRSVAERTLVKFLVQCWRWCRGDPPGIFEEPEAGSRWERAVWSGCCPRWHNPHNPAVAETLATAILQRFEQSHDIGVTADERFTLFNLVGSSSAYGGAMFFEPEQQFLL
jgi:hypothetical protein